MKHAFAFPHHIREAIRLHVDRAIGGVSPARFAQEPAYVAALLARLEGRPYEGSDGTVEFRATNINSLGRGAAEKVFGADFAITAEVERDGIRIAKAILAQAKLGVLSDLSHVERERLVEQIKKMQHFINSPKVMMVRADGDRRAPEILSGARIVEGRPTKPQRLSDYFVRRILTTLDGDTRADFVEAVAHSNLKQLQVIAKRGR
ncbi:MAG TPA: hypothetical protein VFO34_18185 [Candidatus Acidoferrales bacterium]|nr:hypothetical protein [Candidatus Acidoferrales bacterium]